MQSALRRPQATPAAGVATSGQTAAYGVHCSIAPRKPQELAAYADWRKYLARQGANTAPAFVPGVSTSARPGLSPTAVECFTLDYLRKNDCVDVVWRIGATMRDAIIRKTNAMGQV